MSVLAKYVKQPADKKRYTISYQNWLDTGELVTSVTFTTTSPEIVVDGIQLTPDGLGVQYYVSAGLDGKSYTVTAHLTTNSTPPQLREDEIFFSIREQL